MLSVSGLMAFLEVVDKVAARVEPVFWINLLIRLVLKTTQFIDSDIRLPLSLSLIELPPHGAQSFGHAESLWIPKYTMYFMPFWIFKCLPLPLIYLVNYYLPGLFWLPSSPWCACVPNVASTYFYQSTYNHLFPLLVCRADFLYVPINS